MNRAAQDYAKALDDRHLVRKRPPHDVFELQNRVKNVVGRLRRAKEELQMQSATGSGASGGSGGSVLRPVSGKVYAIEPTGKLLLKRGKNGPSAAFWNVDENTTFYLTKNGKNWKITYGPDAGTSVRLVTKHTKR